MCVGGGGGGGGGIVFVFETDIAVRSYCDSLTFFLLCNDFEHCSMILSTHYMHVSFPENTVVTKTHVSSRIHVTVRPFHHY